MTTTLISTNNSGLSGNSSSYQGAITPDGRFVVFYSYASDLTPISDTNGNSDIFVGRARSGSLRLSNSYSVNEQDGSATVTVNRIGGSDGAIAVDYATSDGGAIAGQDYTATSGTLNFANGEASKSFNIPITNDSLDEYDEQFTITLSNPVGGTRFNGPRSAPVTIVDDDPLPSWSINDRSLTEGDRGYTNMDFTVTLSAPSGRSVCVSATTADGTAKGGIDYAVTSQFICFNSGETTYTFSVPIIGDTIDEPKQTFFVNLSAPFNSTIADAQGVGTILDDDPPPSMLINDVSIVEGNSGTTDAVFTVILTVPTQQSVSVHYATANGTAKAGTDYTAVSGNLSFPLGTTSQTISVPVAGDALTEADENFFVNLTSPVNALLFKSQGAGTIIDDESSGALQFSAATFSGTEKSGQATITVKRTGGSGHNVTVDYNTSNGTALGGSDYTPTSGTLTLDAGQTSGTFTVPITHDGLVESLETVNLSLAYPTGGATLGGLTNAVLKIIDHSTPADFDQDGKTDVSTFVNSSHTWFIMSSNNSSLSHRNDWGDPALGDQITPGDYDGDGQTDFAYFRPAEGNWYVLNSSTNSPTTTPWGMSGDVPVQADYDGDGLTDMAVFRPSEGNWYVRKSGGGMLVRNWGGPGDKLLPGDYDGDGKADVAVFRPSEGNWYIVKSSDNGLSLVNWGTTGDIPVPGDYDGDGITDVAVFRVSEGNWYAIKSSDSSMLLRNWGGSGDIPVPGDYDGDNRADIAVYRPSEGNWYIIQSSNNSMVIPNLSGDRQVPNAYLPQ